MPETGEGQEGGTKAVSLEEFTFEKVKEALNNNAKHGKYDDPEFIEAVADHAAYRSMKTDKVEEFSVAEARRVINDLVHDGKLKLKTDEFWTDDKVTLP